MCDHGGDPAGIEGLGRRRSARPKSSSPSPPPPRSLIDDDENLCDSLSFQLKKAGFQVDSCQDGAESLLWIRQNAYDLLILDRMLPGLSGTDILKALRREGNPPVILLTALGEVRDRVAGLEAGADDYLIKPFAFEELLARIHSLSRRPHTWKKPEAMHCGDLTFDTTSAAGLILCPRIGVDEVLLEGPLPGGLALILVLAMIAHECKHLNKMEMVMGDQEQKPN